MLLSSVQEKKAIRKSKENKKQRQGLNIKQRECGKWCNVQRESLWSWCLEHSGLNVTSLYSWTLFSSCESNYATQLCCDK